ncbi:MAG: imidazoleglycerol-phosphate dehydratase HisB [Gammaproteobacteria bacterium]|nr:MAG: imidazoleglycerol-phosphate dehydratase HisB [Gammaproteobacteria bacterium]
MSIKRTNLQSRQTNETQVSVDIKLDGTGLSDIDTSVPFLDHMLEQLSKHSGIDLKIKATGDNHIDDHHSVEDIGITLGQAFVNALGDKKGINRFGSFYAPLDESLSRVVIDLSGRPYLDLNVNFKSAKLGTFDTQLVYEFFQGFVNNSAITLHIDNLKGTNDHHKIESIFKAFARAVKIAISFDSKNLNSLPSTKGVL